MNIMAQTTQFSYQGYLESSGAPADGMFDFRATIYTDEIGFVKVGGDNLFENVEVVDGVFNLTLDVGTAAFGGAPSRWVEIAYRPGNEAGSYTVLLPRSRIGVAPMALGLPGVTVTSATGRPNNLITIRGDRIDVNGDNSLAALAIDSADPEGSGIDITSLEDGIYVYSAGLDGVYVRQSDGHAFSVSNAGQDGLWVDNAINGVLVWNATSDGVDIKHADGYGVNADGAQAGAYLRNDTEISGVRVPDLILGANAGGAAENDDGVIQSDPNYPGSDLIFRVNDAIAVFLDEDGENDGDFEVYGDNGALVFNVDDGGLVSVPGTLSKAGGTFEIDHPLDPANRILRHSFVESPDMKNVYDGTVRLDAAGEAVVELPAYFEALNADFRYQLTCIGGYAPVYVAQKIQNNRFRIAGGTPGLEVSWQVTGTRQDAWANQNRIVVEEDKQSDEQGRYLHPQAFGRPASQSVFALERDTPRAPVDTNALQQEEGPERVRREPEVERGR